MNLRRVRNRIREWRLPVLAVVVCLLCVKMMENRAGNLDRLCDTRQQALEDLAMIRAHLQDYRGRHTVGNTSLGTVLRTTLSDPAMRELFPGLRPHTRTTHAGLFVKLTPAEEVDR